MLFAISRRKDILKPTHRHIFEHSTPTTQYWHLQSCGVLMGAIVVAFVGVCVSFVSTIGALVCVGCLVLECCVVWFATNIISVVDEANLQEIMQKVIGPFHILIG